MRDRVRMESSDFSEDRMAFFKDSYYKEGLGRWPVSEMSDTQAQLEFRSPEPT